MVPFMCSGNTPEVLISKFTASSHRKCCSALYLLKLNYISIGDSQLVAAVIEFNRVVAIDIPCSLWINFVSLAVLYCYNKSCLQQSLAALVFVYRFQIVWTRNVCMARTHNGLLTETGHPKWKWLFVGFVCCIQYSCWFLFTAVIQCHRLTCFGMIYWMVNTIKV